MPIKTIVSLGQNLFSYADTPIPVPDLTPEPETSRTLQSTQQGHTPFENIITTHEVAHSYYRQNTNIVREILSKFQGLNLDQEYIQNIKELEAIEAPLTGGHVVPVLENILRKMQKSVPQPELQKVLQQFVVELHSTSLDQINISAVTSELSVIPAHQLSDVILENITSSTIPEPSNPTNPCITKIEEAQQELEKMQKDLGGSPNFPNQKPSYNPKSKKFFGIPLESCVAWCQKQIEKKTFPVFLWKILAKAFGAKEYPESPYEKAYLYLESLKFLALNQSNIETAFLTSNSLGEDIFTSTSRLACHPSQNGGALGMIRNVQMMLELFSSQFEHAKHTSTLIPFFMNVTTGVCFEDRLSILTNHAMTNQILEAEEGGASGGLNLSKVIDHDPKDDMLTALVKEIESLATDDPSIQPYGGWNAIRDHLGSVMVGLEREAVDDSGTPLGTRAPITMQDIERLRAAINAILFFEDDG